MGHLLKGGLIVKTSFLLDPHFIIEIHHLHDDNITCWNKACIKSFAFDPLTEFSYGYQVLRTNIIQRGKFLLL